MSTPFTSTSSGDPVAVERELEQARGLQLVREAKRAYVHLDALAAAPVGTRPVGRTQREIAKSIQLEAKTLGGQCLPDVEVDRLGVHARRQGPASPLELSGDATVEAEHRDQCREQQQQDDDNCAALQLAADSGRELAARHVR